MEKELEEILVKKYPAIFKDYGGDVRKTCMGWGMSCGDGWFTLLDDLCGDINHLIKGKDIEVVARQVKEKFGGLRFYHGVSYKPGWFSKLNTKIRQWICKKGFAKQYWKANDFRKKVFSSTIEKINDTISKAEAKSYTICESCGCPGNRRPGGWVRTLCDNCDEEVDKD